MLNPKEIGARIKGLRTLKEMTLEEVASKLQVSRSTILRYERGEFERIKLPVLLAIANALGVSPEYLCNEADDCGLSEALKDFQTSQSLAHEQPPTPKDDVLSAPERALIAAYRAASPDDRAIIDNIVRRYTHPRAAAARGDIDLTKEDLSALTLPDSEDPPHIP